MSVKAFLVTANMDNIKSLAEYFARKLGLTPTTDTCVYCGAVMDVSIPFMTKNWVGFKSKKCECPKGYDSAVAVMKDPSQRKKMQDMARMVSNEFQG